METLKKYDNSDLLKEVAMIKALVGLTCRLKASEVNTIYKALNS